MKVESELEQNKVNQVVFNMYRAMSWDFVSFWNFQKRSYGFSVYIPNSLLYNDLSLKTTQKSF